MWKSRANSVSTRCCQYSTVARLKLVGVFPAFTSDLGVVERVWIGATRCHPRRLAVRGFLGLLFQIHGPFPLSLEEQHGPLGAKCHIAIATPMAPDGAPVGDLLPDQRRPVVDPHNIGALDSAQSCLLQGHTLTERLAPGVVDRTLLGAAARFADHRSTSGPTWQYVVYSGSPLT